jgi:hypothetical protein
MKRTNKKQSSSKAKEELVLEDFNLNESESRDIHNSGVGLGIHITPCRQVDCTYPVGQSERSLTMSISNARTILNPKNIVSLFTGVTQ